MILLVDIGNTRVKWACADDGRVGDTGAFVRACGDAGPDYARAWTGLRPQRVACCSVAGAAPVEQLRAWAEGQGGASVRELRPGEPGPITTAYRDPARLGADRWANLRGARRLLGAGDCVIVDAGTAVTVDALRADGHHPGGAIFAGLAAGRAGLQAAAPGLAGDIEEGPLPSDRTTAAVGSGTLFALAGAVERVAREVGAGLERPRRVVTGGDAARLRPLLDGDWIVEPRITLLGLLDHAEA